MFHLSTPLSKQIALLPQIILTYIFKILYFNVESSYYFLMLTYTQILFRYFTFVYGGHRQLDKWLLGLDDILPDNDVWSRIIEFNTGRRKIMQGQLRIRNWVSRFEHGKRYLMMCCSKHRGQTCQQLFRSRNGGVCTLSPEDRWQSAVSNL